MDQGGQAMEGRVDGELDERGIQTTHGGRGFECVWRGLRRGGGGVAEGGQD